MHNIINNLFNAGVNVVISTLIIVLLPGCSITEKTQVHKPITHYIANNMQPPLFEHLKILSSDDFSGRKIGSEGNLKAQDYIISVLKHENVASFGKDFRHHFIKERFVGETRGSNIIGVIKGHEFTERYIVLSAHYDHLGTHGRKIFNGSDDNASGTAALLEIAKKLIKMPLRYSVILLFTDGEEANLSGAKAFVKDYKGFVNNIMLNINLDMIAGDKKTNTLGYIEHGLQTLITDENMKVVNQINVDSQLKLRRGFRRQRDSIKHRINWKMASDHGVFYKEKIPFIYYGVGTNKNYHTAKDTYQNVNLPFYLAATDFIYSQLRLIDTVLE